MKIELCRFVGARGPLTRSAVFSTLALTVALALACGGSSAAGQAGPERQVRGLVVEVVNRSIVEVETLRIRDDAGTIWSFTGAEGFIGVTPSHLREHQLMGWSVLVTYVQEGGALVALDIVD